MSETDRGLILWGVGTSRTVRAHWALHELGLRYEIRPILPRNGDTQTPEFTALTARQKIPLLQDHGLIMTESAAIICYLSDAYGQPHNRLVPLEVRPRARCMEWCFFVISELDATSLYVMRRHGDLRHVYGEAPLANEAAAADILLSTCISWALRYGVPVADTVVAYNERVKARAAYVQALASNAPPAGIKV